MQEAIHLLDRSEIERIVQQAKQLNYSSESVREGERLLALAEEEFFQLEIERAEQLGVSACCWVHRRTFGVLSTAVSSCATFFSVATRRATPSRPSRD